MSPVGAPPTAAALTGRVRAVDPERLRLAAARIDALAKPPGSLGRLEDLAVRLAAAVGLPPAPLARRTILVLAADHGVAGRGVSAYPAEVTGAVVRAIAEGKAAIRAIAGAVGAEVVVADLGLREPTGAAGVLDRRVRAGTADLSRGPAMTEDEALRALAAGFDLGADAARRSDVVGLGEVGIGNTTAAAALTVALTGAAPEDAVGPGTGLDAAGLERKRAVVAEAVSRLPEDADALEILRRVGGLEIAGLAGAALGAAAAGRPVVLDGYATTAAALVAAALDPAVAGWLFASHRSAEPGHRLALDRLGLAPVLDLGLRLGEGTGAALALPVLEAAGAVLRETATLASILGEP